MSAHTPGPWRLKQYEEYDEDGNELQPQFAHAIVSADEVHTVCGTCDGCHKINIANARLIAAAPEMLEALERIIDGEYDNKVHPTDRERARAAIAKARGES